MRAPDMHVRPHVSSRHHQLGSGRCSSGGTASVLSLPTLRDPFPLPWCLWSNHGHKLFPRNKGQAATCKLTSLKTRRKWKKRVPVRSSTAVCWLQGAVTKLYAGRRPASTTSLPPLASPRSVPSASDWPHASGSEKNACRAAVPPGRRCAIQMQRAISSWIYAAIDLLSAYAKDGNCSKPFISIIQT